MKIEITAKKAPETVDVVLGLEQVYNIVRNALLDVYGLEEGNRLADGNVVSFDAPVESESRMRIIRKADDRDVEGLTALANLAAWYRRKCAEEQESNDS
jgi:hypothetical protein